MGQQKSNFQPTRGVLVDFQIISKPCADADL